MKEFLSQKGLEFEVKDIHSDASAQNDMAEMGMPWPENSIPMVGARGPFDYITMGGMFTIVKVREGLADYEDPGWYEHPDGTVADLASSQELRRDLGIS